MSVLSVGAPTAASAYDLNHKIIISYASHEPEPLSGDSYQIFYQLHEAFGKHIQGGVWNPSVNTQGVLLTKYGDDYVDHSNGNRSDTYNIHYNMYVGSNGMIFFIEDHWGSNDAGGFEQQWHNSYIVDVGSRQKYFIRTQNVK
jgi:hypothetical protein